MSASLTISENAREIAVSSVFLAHKENKLIHGYQKTGLEELLENCERLFHRMTLVSRATYKKFIQHILASTTPGDPAEIAVTQDGRKEFTPEMKGTLRYVAGWAIHKEIKRSTRYILQNTASRNSRVLSTRKNEIIMRNILLSLRGDKSTVADPETMTTIMRRDRGALTNVSDLMYGVFEDIQTRCDSVLTLELMNSVDVNAALSRARNIILNDEVAKETWSSVLSSVRENSKSCESVDSLAGETFQTGIDYMQFQFLCVN